jgi:hypothetical protein
MTTHEAVRSDADPPVADWQRCLIIGEPQERSFSARPPPDAKSHR